MGSSTLLKLMGENVGGVSTFLRLIGKQGEGAGGDTNFAKVGGLVEWSLTSTLPELKVIERLFEMLIQKILSFMSARRHQFLSLI